MDKVVKEWLIIGMCWGLVAIIAFQARIVEFPDYRYPDFLGVTQLIILCPAIVGWLFLPFIPETSIDYYVFLSLPIFGGALVGLLIGYPIKTMMKLKSNYG